MRYILDNGEVHGLSTLTNHLGKCFDQMSNLKKKKLSKIGENCLIAAIFLYDIFLDNHDVEFWRLHLIASACLRVAAKLHEHYSMVPGIGETNTDSIFHLDSENTVHGRSTFPYFAQLSQFHPTTTS